MFVLFSDGMTSLLCLAYVEASGRHGNPIERNVTLRIVYDRLFVCVHRPHIPPALSLIPLVLPRVDL